MEKLNVKAYAKINLSLDILGKRKDGYHEIYTIMQSIDLCDILEFERNEEIKLICDDEKVPKGEDNLIIKAVKILKERYEKEGVLIRLNKKIPLAAGLAGGSADAAATIVALNKLWDLSLSEEEQKEIALKLGADVSFCLEGGTKIARGVGEILEDLKTPQLDLLIIKPDIEVSTKEIYQEWDKLNIKSQNCTAAAIQAVNKGNLYEIAKSIGNDLEIVTSSKFKVVQKIKSELLKKGALGCAMTGSGPTVYGIFDDPKKLEKAYVDLKENYGFVAFAKTIGKGLEFYD
ncbi:4-diphosphocytidyl-2-C-methyl-D-erythritol kinase IspE [Thermoanaerobacter kivui]|uniref:4-diphosphocytidyl-2-C-methyl-D-erythritol kinase n=1 Tax=Thermoanaerobacter kivui TaxID=2325 RepID=A0A097AUD8_THEKI|nr:4-(cytidine 5'-diphospho)-2-C-methyl-D-erythritol kinase [Thermoanaerobacter kivui]AIS53418.1 4-diphosphocytidyl-2-C-methyl-D-erythritol kinase IspE [Thermoanaerobacter kivui]